MNGNMNKKRVFQKYSLICFFIFLFSNLFAQNQFSAIELNALNAPLSLKNDLIGLTEYLTKPCANDIEKVRSIYVWIAEHIDFDLKSFEKSNRNFYSAQKILNIGKADSRGFAQLFQAMCEQAGITCRTIEGYSKAFPYVQGDVFIRTEHDWNAVFINNKWSFIDLTCGSGNLLYEDREFLKFASSIFGFIYIKDKLVFKKKMNDEFFLIEPKKFFFSHLPANPMWQLIDCPISVNSFEKKPSEIAADMDKAGIIPCYSFIDSIAMYEHLNEPQKSLKSAEDALFFNQRNKKNLADATVNYANLLFDVEHSEMNKIQKDENISFYQKAKNLYSQFKEQINLKYKTAFERNKSMNDICNKENEEYVAKNTRLISKNKKIIQRNSKEKKKLFEENKNLANQNHQLKYESIENVKKTRKINTLEEVKVIETNFQIIKENKEKINKNKNNISNLCRNNQEELELFINKNMQDIIENNKKNATLIKQNIAFKKENNHLLDTLIILNNDSISQNKKTETELRIINNKESKDYIEENLNQIEKFYKENKSLIKENKKLIRKNKHMSIEDRKENEMFMDENKLLIDDNQAMITSNISIMRNDDDDNILLKKENKMLKKENVLLLTENDLENLRFRNENKFIGRRFVNEMLENEWNIRFCKNRISLLNKVKIKIEK